MRALGRLLASDLRYGLATVLPRFGLVAALAVIVFFLSYATIYVKFPEAAHHLTLGEGILCLWRGMLPYVPEQGEPFKFPMAWFALLVAMAYAVADYPFRDLNGIGARIIVACHSRGAWWLAKCAWVITAALVCWLTTFAVAATVAWATGGGWDLSVRPGVAAVLSAGRNAELSEATKLLAVRDTAQALALEPIPIGWSLVSCAAALIAVLLLQTTVSLLVNPIVGIIASISVLFFSAYFRFWWLPGEYLMLARTDTLMRAGMHPWVGIALSCALALGAVAVGGLAFNRKNILGKEGDDR